MSRTLNELKMSEERKLSLIRNVSGMERKWKVRIQILIHFFVKLYFCWFYNEFKKFHIILQGNGIFKKFSDC